MDRGIQRGQYNYDTETGEISIYRSIRWYEGMFALLVSAGVAGSVCLGVKRRYSMEQTERERANSLLAYRADTKFAFGDSGDNLIRKFITSVPIPRPTQNHSPGGSGQSSGRSSTTGPAAEEATEAGAEDFRGILNVFYAHLKGMRDIIRYRCGSEKYLLSGCAAHPAGALIIDYRATWAVMTCCKRCYRLHSRHYLIK